MQLLRLGSRLPRWTPQPDGPDASASLPNRAAVWSTAPELWTLNPMNISPHRPLHRRLFGLLAASVLLAAGCDGSSKSEEADTASAPSSGTDAPGTTDSDPPADTADSGLEDDRVALWERYPLDGHWEWSYNRDGTEDLYEVRVLPQPEVLSTDGDRIVRVEHREPGTVEPSLYWLSSSSDAGVRLHASEVDGAATSWDPPVQLVPAHAHPGETLEVAYGTARGSTAIGEHTDCVNDWVSDVWACIPVTLSDGGAGTGLGGVWFQAQTWGTSNFQRDVDPSPWRLREASWETYEHPEETSGEAALSGLPAVIELEGEVDSTAATVLTLASTGDAPLVVWHIELLDTAGGILWLEDTSFLQLEPGQQTDVVLTLSGSTPTETTGLLRVLTNDPAQADLRVPVSATLRAVD